MEKIVLKELFSYEEEEKLCRKFAKDKDYTRTIDHECRAVNEQGEPLFILLRNRFTKKELRAYYKAIHNKISLTDNRGTSSGQKAQYNTLQNGTVSKSSRTKEMVYSSIMGYYDRYPRINYCRRTAFNDKYPELFQNALPGIQRASELFKEFLPERWEIQNRIASQTSDDFVIPKTVFTTVTLNKNFRTAYHRDAGDLKEGFGCMLYMRTGKFAGGDLVMPRYGVRVKLRTGDLILFDVHTVHGNTEIIPMSKGYERITCVHFYRKNMIFCGTAQDELNRAKSNGGLGPTTQNLNPKGWKDEK